MERGTVRARQAPFTFWPLFWNASTTISYGTEYEWPMLFCVTDTKGCRLAIMGLTYQYTTSRISRTEYDKYHSIFYDEVFRLNPPITAGSSATTSLHPDDSSIRATDELRFLLFRHWNLYDAMYHSSYVAGKLGIWRERGKKKLSGLLAKMG